MQAERVKPPTAALLREKGAGLFLWLSLKELKKEKSHSIYVSHRYLSCEQKCTGHEGSWKLSLPWARLLPALLWDVGVTQSVLTQIGSVPIFPSIFPFQVAL